MITGDPATERQHATACATGTERLLTSARTPMEARRRQILAPERYAEGGTPHDAGPEAAGTGDGLAGCDNYDALPTRKAGRPTRHRWLPPLLLAMVLITCRSGFTGVHGAATPAKSVLPGYGLGPPMFKRMGGLADSSRISNLTRLHSGDLFYTFESEKCDTDTCVGLSSGTAELSIGGDRSHGGTGAPNGNAGSSAHRIPGSTDHIKEIDMSSDAGIECKCQCLPHLSTYREDLGICVDDIRECTLAPFISGSSSEKIPFVFLPHRGQIVHPSREIGFPGVKMPMCAVSAAQYLTTNGWAELRNPIDTDVPFRLFRDEGRIYLQWLGEPELRQRMQGRLVLVHLMCRDMTPRLLLEDGRAALHHDDMQMPNQNIFTPCIAFRVVGTPIKYVTNVTEVSFASETHIEQQSGLSTKEYIVIAVCSLCLGLIYIASVFLYIHMKKRKSRSGSNDDGSGMKNDYSTYQQNDQVTFGVGMAAAVSPFGGQARASFIGRNALGGSQRQGGGPAVGPHRGLTNVGLHAEEMGIVKNNPLLKHFPNLSDNSGFISDNSNSVSEFEDDITTDVEKQMQTGKHQPKNFSGRTEMDGELRLQQQQQLSQQSALLLHHHHHLQQHLDHHQQDPLNTGGQDTECLPEENVSIVEELNNEEKLESMKSIVNGTMRRKLYFNPAYFEPHLLVSPPPAAIEFLNKIREVITIAKYKMSSKRFQPSLNIIPEELQQAPGSETYAAVQTAPASRRSSLISSRKDSSRKSACSGCPGCEKKLAAADPVMVPSSNCRNCGDKQNSIRKWLEDVSSNHGDGIAEADLYDSKSNLLASSSETDGPTPTPKGEGGVMNPAFVGDQQSLESLKSHDDRPTAQPDSLPIRPDIKKQPKTHRSSKTGSLHSDSSSTSDNETIVANSVKERSSVVRIPSASKSVRSDTSSAPKIVSHSLKTDLVSKMSKFGMQDGAGALMKNSSFIYEESRPAPSNQDLYIKNTNNSVANLDTNKVYDKRDLYNITGSEIYNNPQFEASPVMSHKMLPVAHSAHHHHHGNGKKPAVNGVGRPLHGTAPAAPAVGPGGPMSLAASSSKRRQEVMDQYANVKPMKLRNINQMPDMVYEALAMDQRKIRSWSERHADRLLPPMEPIDYNVDSSDSRFSSIDRHERYRNEKFFHDFLNSDQECNTLGNRSGKNSYSKYQPDSPIYSRKSPHYLIVDYETDSLERVTSKTPMSFNTSTTNSSDLGSQPSPSLSTALPLEEEVEIRNAIYDRVEGFRKDTDTIKTEREAVSIRSDEYEDVPHEPTANGKPRKKVPKIKCDTPFQGSITIEVEHSPDDCDLSATDSDQFEPDTLDRKPKKNGHKAAVVSRHRSNVWEGGRGGTVCGGVESNLTSLPADLNSHFVLKSTGSFKHETSFGSLREIYESKNPKVMAAGNPAVRSSLSNLSELDVKSGKLLTLETRHSRRQRTNVGEAIIPAPKMVPPDLIPPETARQTTLYDHPRMQLKKVEDYGVSPKNLACWSNSEKLSNPPTGPAPKPNFCTSSENYESINSLTAESDSTQFTGISDNDRTGSGGSNSNSSSTGKNRVSKLPNYSHVQKNPADQSLYITDKTEYARIDEKQSSGGQDALEGILESYMTLGELNSKNFLQQVDSKIYDLRTRQSQQQQQQQQVMSKAKFIEDIDKIEVLSTKTLSNYSYPINRTGPSINPKDGEDEKPSIYDISAPMPVGSSPSGSPTTTKVFRVELNQSSNGMQIAMGLRDRVKKSKDLKNAWKKFIGIATAKFNGKSGDPDLEKTSDSSDILEKDEGISSLIDESSGSGAYGSHYQQQQLLRHHHHHHHHRKRQTTGPTAEDGEKPSTSRNITIVRSNSRSSTKEQDSGYMSADSSETKLNGKKIYERYNFSSQSPEGTLVGTEGPIVEENKYEICALQESNEQKPGTPETTGTNRSGSSSTGGSSAGGTRTDKSITRPRSPPPPLPPPNPPPPPPPTATIPSKKKSHPGVAVKVIEKPHSKPPPPPPSPPSSATSLTTIAQAALTREMEGPGPSRQQRHLPTTSGVFFNTSDAISVRVYSSDDEKFDGSDDASCISDDDDLDSHLDDISESGAESVETHSVFFKNIRKPAHLSVAPPSADRAMATAVH
uniref:Shavenoid isoform B-like N-terminal domain-containing protein n=1 Tax=Anopheles dirus TaxID=7168 RepID=A0A9I3EGX6_9DIPT